MNFVGIRDLLSSIPKKAILGAIRCYRATRFFRSPSCRFYPSCSQYVAGCVERHGVFKGALLGGLRLAKCHPWHPGGVDEVPAIWNLCAGRQYAVEELRGSRGL